MDGEGDAAIYGRMHYPIGFDPAKTYPVAVASHGFGGISGIFDGSVWLNALTKAGFVVYTYDFCGSTNPDGWLRGKSEGGFENFTILTEADDLNLYEMMTGYTGNVLIIHGLKDGMVPFTASVKAIEECYDNQLAELVVIAGEKSDHGFENAWIGHKEDAMMSALANWQSGYAD